MNEEKLVEIVKNFKPLTKLAGDPLDHTMRQIMANENDRVQANRENRKNLDMEFFSEQPVLRVELYDCYFDDFNIRDDFLPDLRFISVKIWVDGKNVFEVNLDDYFAYKKRDRADYEFFYSEDDVGPRQEIDENILPTPNVTKFYLNIAKKIVATFLKDHPEISRQCWTIKRSDGLLSNIEKIIYFAKINGEWNFLTQITPKVN